MFKGVFTPLFSFMIEKVKNFFYKLFHHVDDEQYNDDKYHFVITMDSPEQAQEIILEIFKISHPTINCIITTDKTKRNIVSIEIYSFQNDMGEIKNLIKTFNKLEKEIKNHGQNH